MKRYPLLAVLTFLLAAPPAQAQEAPDATRVYVAYYQVAWGDLVEWLEIYQASWSSRLDALVEAGEIVGYGAQIHNTGGIYNFRLAMRGTQDTNYDRVWEEFMGTWMAEDPDSFNRVLALMDGHDDEIWNIDELVVTPGAAWQYMYDNQVELAYSDWMGYTDRFKEAAGDLLEQARADGVISGWVIESHNTGGRFNWKIMFLFPEWGDIHEFQTRMLAALPLDHPMWDAWKSHRDDIWETLPAGGN
ncbi:MAG TPA: hypothetical protein VLA43_21315 [Longimicrobiales bacterium]|nr:hypothetical protein [Longimicrobiales bacterium]